MSVEGAREGGKREAPLRGSQTREEEREHVGVLAQAGGSRGGSDSLCLTAGPLLSRATCRETRAGVWVGVCMCAHVLDVVCRYGAGVCPTPRPQLCTVPTCVCARVLSSSFLVKPVFLRLRFSSDTFSFFFVVPPFLLVGGPSTCLKVNQ